MCYQIHPEKFE